ncbi:hypothetical protein KC19_5G113300 [Ceratodon purpureus]|uniref:Uncharacterized protein n=1 Tax=Ceratodon purpureus TaxID=3225 RepID=A0A8T0I085_CERPU|nr:hypothetical protein KC19_5G112900 [Ceratodon purpureus]KAG0576851.1 hypothetical protein KC19_5G113000 [Ceratodon purpureus]KAG0576854.1 hypothetical protein KC19_5G113300 [Ceratodon purpureus]
MASRTSSSALLLLALFGAALFLQVAFADDAVAGASTGDMVTASNKANIIGFNATPSEIDPDTTDGADDGVDDQLLDMTNQGTSEAEKVAGDSLTVEGDDELGEVQPYVYVPEADEVEVVAGDEDQHEASFEARRPLARILNQRSSKKCWRKQTCLKFYKRAGCCQKKCVNLATSNSNCGKCKKYCNTKKGYFCQSGKCRKRHSDVKSCKTKNGCKGENSCCKGKCVNVRHDDKNCGKCGTQCLWGSACCGRYCKNLKTDRNNCGKCGRKCGKGDACCNGVCVCLKKSSDHCGSCGKACTWGRKCCGGNCVSVTSDKDNCGRCGKRCRSGVKCTHGICGYGH